MRLRLLAASTVMGAALVVTGCTNDDPPTTEGAAATSTTVAATASPSSTAMATATASATGSMTEGTPSSDTAAAQLRAGLTALLQEHVYLAGAATHAALTAGDFDGAAAALDENTVALSEAIGSVYGEDAGDAFAGGWRTHIGFFVDYTTGTAEGDSAKVEAAREALDGYRQDFGAFLASANPNFAADAVAEELIPHLESLFAVIDAQAAGTADQWSLLRVAAGHMPHTAAILAEGIATQMPDTFAGDSTSGGSELRSGLTALLQEHVYLATLATDEALAGGDFDGAAAALDENTVALSDAIGSVYGDDARGAFIELWRTHIGFFVDYTLGVAHGDAAKAEAAEAALDGYRTDFGAFLASANPSLTTEAVAEELIPHVESVFAVIDAQAEADGTNWAKMRVAAGHMSHTAAVLAGAITTQMPEQFAANVSHNH